MIRLSNRDPWDYTIEDPKVLTAYAELYGVEVDHLWWEDTEPELWDYIAGQEAHDEEQEHEACAN